MTSTAAGAGADVMQMQRQRQRQRQMQMQNRLARCETGPPAFSQGRGRARRGEAVDVCSLVNAAGASPMRHR